MLDLLKPVEDFLIYNKKRYSLNLAFDNVLRIYRLLESGKIDEPDKFDLALSMFIQEEIRVPFPQNLALLNYIFENFIASSGKKCSDNEKIVDFLQDGAYIYSSFLMDYGIDLLEERGKLHWQKFIALFQGLSERTKIREVMSIRARKIPSPTKYNYEEIQNLRDLKEYYALEVSSEEIENNWQNGLASLAEMLKQRAVNE